MPAPTAMIRRLAAAAALAALLLACPAAAVLPAQPDYLRMGEAAAAAAYPTTFAEGPGPGELAQHIRVDPSHLKSTRVTHTQLALIPIG